MRAIYAAILFLFAVAVIVFCVQNLETVSVSYLGWNASLPLPLLVLLVYFLGMISGWGLLSFLRQSLRRVTVAKDKAVEKE